MRELLGQFVLIRMPEMSTHVLKESSMINETAENPRTTQRSLSRDHIQTVTGSTFKPRVLEGKGPIAVEFMSYGCVHCREMEPILQQVAEMVKSKGTIFRVNTADDQELTYSYEIEGTPTLVMFLNGKEVGRAEGPPPKVSSVLTAVTHPFESNGAARGAAKT